MENYLHITILSGEWKNLTPCKCGYGNLFNETDKCGYCGEEIGLPDIDIVGFENDSNAKKIMECLGGVTMLGKSEYWYKLDCAGIILGEKELVKLFKKGYYRIAWSTHDGYTYISTREQVEAIARLHGLQ